MYYGSARCPFHEHGHCQLLKNRYVPYSTAIGADTTLGETVFETWNGHKEHWYYSLMLALFA